MDDYAYIGVFVPISVVVPLFVAIFRFRKLEPKAKIIIWYLLFDGISNFIYRLLAMLHINNMLVSHLFTITELFILCGFFATDSGRFKIPKYTGAIILLFILIAFVNVCFFQNILSYNSYTRSLETLIVIFLSVNNFLLLLDKQERKIDFSIPEVYFTSGILLYFSGAFFIFLFFQFFNFDKRMATLLWNTHATFLLLMYLIFAVGLWKYKRS